MVLKLFTLIALLVAVPLWAQDSPIAPTPTHVIVDSCLGLGCGGVAAGPGIDILSVAGTVILPGGSVPVVFGGSLPTGTNTIGAINLAQYTPTAGRLPVFADINGPVAVTGTFFQPTQPISAVSLPLPTGAATNAALIEVRDYLDTVETKLQSVLDNQATLNAKDFATQTTLALIKAKTDNLDALLSTLSTAAGQTTGNGSLATLAAKDFATSAKQDTENVSLASIDAKLSMTATAAGVALNVALPLSAPIALPKPPCNAVRRTNCQPKGF